MAGGAAKYRHLSRKSSHRQALLRNLVTSLFEHDNIQTTWHKAKEAQRLADKLITMGKKNTEASRRSAGKVFYRHELLDKLFGPLRERYATRPGGYTRVLRVEPLKEDQAPSAILELVDSPKDMRFALMAKVVARQRAEKLPETDITRANLKKVLQFRGDDGKNKLEKMIDRFGQLTAKGREVKEVRQEKVYPNPLDPNKGKRGTPYQW